MTLSAKPCLIAVLLFLSIGMTGVGNAVTENMAWPDLPASGQWWPVSQPAGPTEADFARAEQFLPQNVIPSLYNVNIEPTWISGTSSFWYVNDGRTGKQFIRVNASTMTRQPAFDHAALAGALGAASGSLVDPAHLPFDDLTFSDGIVNVTFTAVNSAWTWNSGTGQLERLSDHAIPGEGDLVSPDGQKAVFLQDNNLYLRDLTTGATYPLTTDGTDNYFYARTSDTTFDPVSALRSGDPVTPYAQWSPDSTRILTFQVDQREVLPLYLVQDAPEDGTLRPKEYTFRYSMPGEEHVALYEPVTIDVESRQIIRVRYEPWPETSMMDAGEWNLRWWNANGSTIYSLYVERGEKTLRFLEEDPVSGQVREILSESGDSYRESNLDYGGIPNIYVYEKNGDIIWFSERDGYGHLYRYDRNGTLKNQITSGAWVVRTLQYVDEENEWIFFSAGGREPGRDPYYRHLYRVRPDGTGFTLLTPEDADHEISMSPDGAWFVDSYSRVDTVPRTILRNSAGDLLMQIEEGDISYLTSRGWNPPERITVKARDGITDLYGLLILPTTFDSLTSYPVVDAVYPGPQIIVTTKAFPSDYGYNSKIFWRAQALSELGFIVVNLDGLGTPYRSKAFHDVSYGHMGDAGGLTDHVGGITDLARTRPFMDLEHVGMYGHSGGGFMTARALLLYPDFYTVGVASAGNHDNRLYGSYWGEKYEGIPVGDSYLEQVTALDAGNLTGSLFLVTGDLDDNVNPSMTIQLASALINANKTFDMLVLPNRNHEFNYDPYFIKRQFDYLILHLQGVEPPEYVFDVPWLPD